MNFKDLHLVIHLTIFCYIFHKKLFCGAIKGGGESDSFNDWKPVINGVTSLLINETLEQVWPSIDIEAEKVFNKDLNTTVKKFEEKTENLQYAFNKTLLDLGLKILKNNVDINENTVKIQEMSEQIKKKIEKQIEKLNRTIDKRLDIQTSELLSEINSTANQTIKQIRSDLNTTLDDIKKEIIGEYTQLVHPQLKNITDQMAKFFDWIQKHDHDRNLSSPTYSTNSKTIRTNHIIKIGS